MTLEQQSGTPKEQTPLGPKILSFVARCPLLRGQLQTMPLFLSQPILMQLDKNNETDYFDTRFIDFQLLDKNQGFSRRLGC